MKKLLLCALSVMLFVCPVLAEAAVTSDDSPPVITDFFNEWALRVFENETVVFVITAVGAEPLAYQWQFFTRADDYGWRDISGANSAVYSFVANGNSEGTYRVIVSNRYGSVVSEGASLIVNPKVTIITQPAVHTTAMEGSITESLFVEADVSPNTYELRYQWYSNTTNSNTGGTLIPDATNANFKIPTTLTAAEHPYCYYCVVSPRSIEYTAAISPPSIDAFDVVSEVAIVTVNNSDGGGGCNNIVFNGEIFGILIVLIILKRRSC